MDVGQEDGHASPWNLPGLTSILIRWLGQLRPRGSWPGGPRTWCGLGQGKHKYKVSGSTIGGGRKKVGGGG